MDNLIQHHDLHGAAALLFTPNASVCWHTLAHWLAAEPGVSDFEVRVQGSDLTCLVLCKYYFTARRFFELGQEGPWYVAVHELCVRPHPSYYRVPISTRRTLGVSSACLLALLAHCSFRCGEVRVTVALAAHPMPLADFSPLLADGTPQPLAPRVDASFHALAQPPPAYTWPLQAPGHVAIPAPTAHVSPRLQCRLSRIPAGRQFPQQRPPHLPRPIVHWRLPTPPPAATPPTPPPPIPPMPPPAPTSMAAPTTPRPQLSAIPRERPTAQTEPSAKRARNGKGDDLPPAELARHRFAQSWKLYQMVRTTGQVGEQLTSPIALPMSTLG